MATLDSATITSHPACSPFDVGSSADLVPDGGSWSFGGADHRHRVAEVVEGRLVLHGELVDLRRPLESMIRALVLAVIEGRPRPGVCRDLPGGDRLVARVEACWKSHRTAARLDPDPDAWMLVVLESVEEMVPDWFFGVLCTLSGQTIQRVDGVGGEECWVAAEPVLLASDLRDAFIGLAPREPFEGDPIRRSRGVVAA